MITEVKNKEDWSLTYKKRYALIWSHLLGGWFCIDITDKPQNVTAREYKSNSRADYKYIPL